MVKRRTFSFDASGESNARGSQIAAALSLAVRQTLNAPVPVP